MRVTVRTLRQGWSAEVEVPQNCFVGELRAVCARAAKISPSSRCKLVLRGAALVDDALVAPLKPDDTVLVAARPVETPPPCGGASGGVHPNGLSRRRVEAGNALRASVSAISSDSDGEDARAADAAPLELSRTRLFVYGVLVRNARAPASVARAVASVSASALAKISAWVILSQVFAYLEHAPLCLLSTGLYLIFTGLGTRRPGEPSAYSVFNGFDELPGTFNAARVDDAIMRRNG